MLVRVARLVVVGMIVPRGRRHVEVRKVVTHVVMVE
jgi:hypothetical protein